MRWIKPWMATSRARRMARIRIILATLRNVDLRGAHEQVDEGMKTSGEGEALSERLGEYALEEQAGGEEAIEGESQDLRVEVGADGARLDLALEVSGEQVQVDAGACQDGLTQLGDCPRVAEDEAQGVQAGEGVGCLASGEGMQVGWVVAGETGFEAGSKTGGVESLHAGEEQVLLAAEMAEEVTSLTPAASAM